VAPADDGYWNKQGVWEYGSYESCSDPESEDGYMNENGLWESYATDEYERGEPMNELLRPEAWQAFYEHEEGVGGLGT